MNKILKVFIAIFGAIEVAFSIAIPILVALLWINFSSLTGWSSYVLLIVGTIASIFRAIKIGWLK